MPRTALLLLSWLTLAAPMKAQDAVVTLLTGDVLRGRWEGFRDDRLVVMTESGERELDPGTILSMTLGTVAIDPADPLVDVELAGGKTIWRGHLAGGQSERLDLRMGPRAVIPLPYGSFRSLRVPARIGQRDVRPTEGSEVDRLYVVVGESLDVIEGVVSGYTSQDVVVDHERGTREVPYENLAALFFGLVEPREPLAGSLATLQFVDGSELIGHLSSMSGGTIEVATVLDEPVTVAVSELASVRFAGDRFALLTDMSPTSVEKVPFFEDGLPPFYVVNRSLRGNPLRVGGHQFDRGIALRPICNLTWELDGTYETFRVQVGIHDEVKPERHMDDPWFATVRFHVDVDGVTVWSSPIVRGGRPPLVVEPISVRGAKRLTLRTDFADRYPAGDHPVWLEPILLR